MTSTYITNADFSSTSGWTEYVSSGYKDIGTGKIGWTVKNAASSTDETHLATDYCFGFECRWQTNYASYNQQISLTPGYYELTYDVQNAYVNAENHSNYLNLFYVQVGSTKYEDSYKEWMSGHSNWTKHTVSFNITETSNTTISLGYGTGSNNIGDTKTPVLYVSHLKLVYTPFATNEDYTNLNAAISTVEGYTLGFEAGEYASYNVLPILNAAKAIDQSANNLQPTVQDLITKLNAITANAAEVNAIYWKTDYTTEDKNSDGYVHPLGWTNTGYNTRFLNTSLSNETALTTIGHCIMSKYNTSYGTMADYPMPLKANTYYTLSFRYCGWGNNPETKVVVKDGSSKALSFSPSSFTPSTSDGNSNAEHWYDFAVTFKTNAAGNYTLELNKVPSGQQQIGWTNMNLVRATAPEIKVLLDNEIDSANDIYNNGANVGAGTFQMPVGAGNIFNTAIATAQSVYDNGSATVDQLATAISDLQSAVTTYNAATLNAPATNKHYWIKVATTEHAKKDNAVVVALGSTSAFNPTGYTFNASAAPAAYLAQAVAFISANDAEHPNRYYITFEGPRGTLYLTNGTTNGSTAGHKNYQIQGTTDSSKKMSFDIVATTTANVFNIYNTATNSSIACQSGGNIYTEAGNADFTLEEATQATVNVTIDAAVKYGTRIFPFNVDIPSGVKAYSCEETDGDYVKLVEVTTGSFAANTPYILEAEDGLVSTDFTGWGTASANAYTAGLLTGVYADTDAPVGSYVLLYKNNQVGFYQVVENKQPTVGANRAYLNNPGGNANVRAFFFDSEDLTGIDAIGALTSGQYDAIYTGNGVKVKSLQKGMNIVVKGSKSYKIFVK